MMYYIVEHQSRGCVIGKEWDGTKFKYRCSWTILRSDPKVIRYYNLKDARHTRDNIKGSYILQILGKGVRPLERIKHVS